VLLKPQRELLTPKRTSGQCQHDLLLFINGCRNFKAVEDEGNFHGRMRSSLVTVDKWMVAHEKEAKGRGFRRDGWVKIFAAKRLKWLSKRRF